ncbi:hypothetical protein [Microbacterium sp. bgisy203]|uniref:hypothetical protein n=1 Tax=Microbacterium sp. bgisy203 TaxID=3413799 RepID=UPI003D736337
MVREPIQLDDETLTEQSVDGVAVDPHLLAHRDTERCHERDEPRLEPGIGEMGCHLRELSGAPTPRDAGEHPGRDGSRADRRLPDAERIDERDATGDVEERVDHRIDELGRGHGHGRHRPMHARAGRLDA